MVFWTDPIEGFFYLQNWARYILNLTSNLAAEVYNRVFRPPEALRALFIQWTNISEHIKVFLLIGIVRKQMWKSVVATSSVMQCWNPSVWLISCWTEFFHLLLSFCSAQTQMICFHPVEHVMLPTPDGMDWNRFQGFWHIFFQCVKSIITIIMKILFNSSPKKFDEVQFTMELWENETKVARSFDGLLYEWFLSLEVRLILKDLFVAAILQSTFFFTFPVQFTLVESPLCENGLDSLWHVGVSRVWRRIYHGLSDFLAIPNKPGVMHFFRLFSTRIDIHTCGHQSILGICRVSLRVVNND